MITRHFLHCLALLTLLSPAVAAPPLWWSDGIPPVIDTNATANNHGPANIGQAKWMVSEALRALDATDPAIASQVRADLAGSPPDYTDRLIDLSVPPEDPKPDDWVAKQKAPLLIGLLKAISAPFYKRIHGASPDWLDYASANAAEPGQLQLNLTKDTSNAAIFYPWTSDISDDANKAIATIGQLKAVFSLRFETLSASLAPEVRLLCDTPPYTTHEWVLLGARVTLKGGAYMTRFKLECPTYTFICGGIDGNVQPPPVSVDIPDGCTIGCQLVYGLNTITIEVNDSAGRIGTSTLSITRGGWEPTVEITSPANDALIKANSINILGTVSSASPLRSVYVNGVSAYFSGGTFEAHNLPVVDGFNFFTVIATDILGQVGQRSITVTGQPPIEDTYVEVTATPPVGVAPLNVMFNVVANVPGTIQQVTYDFEGSGKNLVTATAIAPLAHVYSDPGIFYPRITIRTTVGTFSNRTGPDVPITERLCVAVADGGGDGPLVAWRNLKRRVTAGDFEAAGEFLSESHRDGLKAMIVLLGRELASTMLDNFGELDEISLGDDEATYAAEITTPEGLITFLVDCIKENGTWKINSF